MLDETVTYFPMKLVGDDAEVMIAVVNQGIDSRLEGFTRSTFGWYIHTIRGGEIGMDEYLHSGGEKRYGTVIATKLHCNIHPAEMPILIRRLDELWDWDDELGDIAGELADALAEMFYGCNLGLGLVED